MAGSRSEFLFQGFFFGRMKQTGDARQARHGGGAQQALVIAGHALLVLFEADIDQHRRVHLVAQRLRAVHGEIGVGPFQPVDAAGDADALPDQKRPDGGGLQREIRAAPERHGRLVPGDPVGEEQDMPAFLLHHRLEGLDQLGGEEAGAARHLEQAVGEEAVDAFGIAGDHEAPFGVIRQLVVLLRLHRDVIGGDQAGQHVAVAGFLAGHVQQRLAQRRVLHRVRRRPRCASRP